MDSQKNSFSEFTIRSIGIIHTPLKNPKETPIQPVYAQGIKGRVEIFSNYVEGLRDLDGFSHIYLFYYFHKASSEKLTVKPFLENRDHGVFSTRAPSRPNRIGISLVKLLKMKGSILHIEDVDILDCTPLLDIKPYISRFDYRENAKCGWQDTIEETNARLLGARKEIQ